ncbi:hypothetical protein MMB17_17340 [Methylobacterium organophilum]|uniref:hypothetical protein n=1 Tax=Methylobacterium organophilum TaxID=410 RepID=UPI001F135D38|nr:hypothetical protein [Methylobacterium organophilum]UMY16454.1 hypothetical protein MMB17_17340 [Methylobacterium organophilum]
MPVSPPDPRRVLLVAALLPGMGHVWTGRAARGLGFALFTLVGGWLCAKFASPEASFVGRHAAGFFVWALSLPDAYRCARLDQARAERLTPSPRPS